MDLSEIVVAGVAVYGAGLSTIIYIQKWRDKKPKIIVDYNLNDPRSGDFYAMLIVENHGNKTITLSSAVMQGEAPENDETFLLEPSSQVYGIEVKSGKNYKIFFQINQISHKWLNEEIRLVGIVKDQLGKEYRSVVIEP
jgi:hypothetical protein